MLVIYNYITRATLFYEDISAMLLYNILSKHEEENKNLLKQYEIEDLEYKHFISECHTLLSAEKSSTYVSTPLLKEDNVFNSETKLYNTIYENDILFGMHIDITPHCNFRCIHCYHPFDSYDNTEFTYEEIEDLFKILAELGVFRITISGGEPFLRKDIFQILELGSKYNFIFEIFTNGSLLTEKMVERCSRLNVIKLSFSYYGDKDDYNHITQSNCYDKLMNNVQYCIKYNIDYNLKFILMKCNYHHLQDFQKLTKKLNTRPYIELNIIPKLDSATDNLSEKLDFDDYIEIFKDNQKLFKSFLQPNRMIGEDKIQCNAGRYSLYCDYRGDIYPCVSYRQYLGRYTQLKNIWNGNQLKDIVNKKNIDFSSYRKYSYCDYCYEICPALSIIEGKSEYDCNNSGCTIAKAIEFLYNTKI